MIFGIGTDIVSIDRIRASLGRFGEHFAQRVLTAAEFLEFRASVHPERFIAKRFAAKEAVVKALGLGFRDGLALNQIGVTHDDYGKPAIVYSGRALDCIREAGIAASLVSISDERNYAVAFVVLMGREARVLTPAGD